ncbi:glutathione S-transferase [Marinospirillum alkaliphilum]|uniref:glutathione transferase n=1 Tax=Marinospirillum alkaliphilum DSM 21637 TaxID=1122209 RepID=A0A1K1WQ93_9GAMM|nr:glutathione S-transferase [Marinospirillum alkaliphilum]SFX39568.1 glutathione S-transferase [Marinospirillum alkaliphilum DSM 21637]
MLTLHHLEKSRSHRVLWLLELLGLDYEFKTYLRDPQTLLAPPALKQIHPLGKSPVITDGELVVAESGAIIEYLLQRYGKGRLQQVADDLQGWVDYRHWLHYAEGSLMPVLLMKLVFTQIPKRPMPFFVKPVAKGISNKVLETFVQPNLDTHLAFIEQHLAQHRWFAGDALTAADVQMSFPMLALAARSDLSAYPHIQAYNQQLLADPAWQRVVQKAGPLQIPS